MDAMYRESKVLTTYFVSWDRDGEVAGHQAVSLPFKLNLHQPFETPPEEGHVGNPGRH